MYTREQHLQMSLFKEQNIRVSIHWNPSSSSVSERNFRRLNVFKLKVRSALRLKRFMANFLLLSIMNLSYVQSRFLSFITSTCVSRAIRRWQIGVEIYRKKSKLYGCSQSIEGEPVSTCKIISSGVYLTNDIGESAEDPRSKRRKK